MAVYTKVSTPEVSEFLESYDLGHFVKLTGIKAGVSNSNYILETEQGRHILTLYESRTRREDLPFFLGLMEHLAKKNVPCPLPIRSRHGQAMQELAGRPAVIVSFLDGTPVARVTREDCGEVGRALATMHLASMDFLLHRENDFSLKGWKTLYKSCEAEANTMQADLENVLRSELQFLEAHWPINLPRGVIHADLFPDNVFFTHGKLCGLIDFYFACNDFLTYDLAVCLNSWCFESNNMSFNITKARTMLEGYIAIRPLSEAEIVALPVLCRGAALRFLLTRLYDWLHQVPGALVKAKDPLEYLARLKFHQKISHTSSYGLNA